MDDNNRNGLNNKEFNHNPDDRTNKDNDMEAQIAKSIEKLVEEETNVARAFVNGDHIDPFSIYENKKQLDILNRARNEDSVSMKTQVLPNLNDRDLDDNVGDTRVIGNLTNLQNDQMANNNQNIESTQSIPMLDSIQNTQTNNSNTGRIDFSYQQNGSVKQNHTTKQGQKPMSSVDRNRAEANSRNNSTGNNSTGNFSTGNASTGNGSSGNSPMGNRTSSTSPSGNRSADSQDKGKDKPGMTKKKKLIIAGIIAAAIVVIGIIVAVFVVINNKNKQSFTYNYEHGMERYQKQEYKDAITYLKKASETTDGKKNADLMLALADSYQKEDKDKEAKDTYQTLLSFDKNNEKGLANLAQMYVEEEDGTALTELINKYKGTKGEEYLKDFQITEPSASEQEGSYTHDLTVSLSADDGVEIYYTLNGKDPDKNSTKYSDPIDIENGTTELKVIAIDSIGTSSYIATYKYVIEYKQPDAPSISPESGNYEAGQKITIDNLKSGETAYYTIDGTDPTTSSTVYTGEFDMPTGNVVVSAITVNEYNMSSSVTRRNYVVKEEKSYTFDESVDILKNRMISLNALKSDGRLTKDGGEVTFVYQSKKTIDNNEMYLIRMDVKKNGVTSAQGYYGVGTKNGQCYKVNESGGGYIAASY